MNPSLQNLPSIDIPSTEDPEMGYPPVTAKRRTSFPNLPFHVDLGLVRMVNNKLFSLVTRMQYDYARLHVMTGPGGGCRNIHISLLHRRDHGKHERHGSRVAVTSICNDSRPISGGNCLLHWPHIRRSCQSISYNSFRSAWAFSMVQGTNLANHIACSLFHCCS